MVTPQEVKQQAANLTTEQRAAVNTQLAGMSQEDLAKRSQAPTAPVPQAWPEPELFSEPLAQQPQQAPVEPQALQQPQALVEPVQQPVEPPKVEPIKPIKTEDPVQKVQEVKNQAIINEADEIAVQEQKKTQITSEFQQKLQSGASIKELADFARKNEQFSDSFRDSIRTQFKTQENTKFYAKYNGLSNESMYSAVKSGAIKIWSERYNLLSEAQRQSFEQFKAAKDAPAGIPTTKEEVFNPNTPENSVDFNNIENFANKMFNSDLRKQLDELRNDNRVVSLTQELNAKASELEIFDIEGIRENDNLEDELWNAWFSPAYIRAKLRDNSANRAIERMSKVSEYNRIQWDLQSIRDDIESDIRLFEYEDQQARDKYAFLFNAYESRRGEQRASEALESEREFQRGIRAEDREFSRQQTEEEREYQAQRDEFLEQNQIRAEQRQVTSQKDLAKFNQELKEKDMSWGDYIDDGEWNIVYVKNWKEISVLKWLWKTISVSEDVNYSYEIKDNADGTRTVYWLPKKNGLNIFTETFDIEWTIGSDYVKTIGTWKITSYGWAHDKYQWLDIDWNIWDPINVPLGGKVIEVMSHPLYGNTMVVQFTDGNKARYSHLDKSLLWIWDEFGKGTIIGTLWNTWNVLKMNWEKPSKQELAQWFGSHLDLVTIDENWKTRSAKETEKYLSDINKWSGWAYEEADIPLYIKYNNGKITEADRKAIPDFESFKQEALSYGKDISWKWTPQIEQLIATAKRLMDWDKTIKTLASAWGVPFGKSKEYRADFDTFISANTLNQLIDLKSQWATFGALSEKELETVSSMATNLRLTLPEEAFNAELNRIVSILESGLDKKIQKPTVEWTVNTPSWFIFNYWQASMQSKTETATYNWFFNQQ